VSAPRKGAGDKPAPKRRSGPSGKSGANTHKGYLVRAPDETRELWREAAADEGSPLATWARELLTVQAALQLKRDPDAALARLHELLDEA
jgi:hypothetical protein